MAGSERNRHNPDSHLNNHNWEEFSVNMCKTHLILALLILGLQSASASPRLNFAWRDISFTTDGGTHVEAALDEHYRFKKLLISKHDHVCNVPSIEMENLTGADISNIKVFEEAGYEYTLLKFTGNEFGADSGNPVADITWTLRCNAGNFEKLERVRKSLK